MHIGFIGAGSLARALGGLFSNAGHRVTFSAPHPNAAPDVASFSGVSRDADLVVLAIPYSATAEVLPNLNEHLEGKVVIDVTNPVGPSWEPLDVSADGSGGQTVARLLPGARVVKAFNTVFADVMQPEHLQRGDARVTCFVASNDDAAAQTVADLAASSGFSPTRVGPLAVARHLESVAHLNIQLAVGMKAGTSGAFVYSHG